jgi:hypothetical protein
MAVVEATGRGAAVFGSTVPKVSRNRYMRLCGARFLPHPAGSPASGFCLLGWGQRDAAAWVSVLKAPHNGRGLMIYGATKMEAGDLHGALAMFERALQYTTNYADLEDNLGIVNERLAQRGGATRDS